MKHNLILKFFVGVGLFSCLNILSVVGQSNNFVLDKTLSAPATGGIQNTRFSYNGKYVAAAGRGGDVFLWETSTGKLIYRLKGHTKGVSEVTFSRDDAYLASASADGTAKLWSVATGELLGSYDNEPFEFADGVTYVSVSFVTFSPDGKYLIFGGDNGKIMRAKTGKDVSGKPYPAEKIAATYDEQTNRWYNTITGGTITPDGQAVIVSVGNYLASFNFNTGESVGYFYYPYQVFNDVAEGADKTTVAAWSYDGKISLWAYPKGTMTKILQVAAPNDYSGAAFSYDGKYLATGVTGKNLRVWDWKNGAIIAELTGHNELVRICRWHPKEYMIASASYDGTVKLWKIGTPEIQFLGEALSVGKKVTLKKLVFEQSSYELLAKSYEELDELAMLMTKNSTIKIKINGHTDNVGNAMVNRTLSDRRAIAVMNYLLDKGIKKDRIQTFGFGGDQPVGDNKTEEGRKKNRRVEIEITELF